MREKAMTLFSEKQRLERIEQIWYNHPFTGLNEYTEDYLLEIVKISK